MIKNNYEQPYAELIVVRFEENVMSPIVNSNNHTEYLTGGVDDDYEEL